MFLLLSAVISSTYSGGLSNLYVFAAMPRSIESHLKELPLRTVSA